MNEYEAHESSYDHQHKKVRPLPPSSPPSSSPSFPLTLTHTPNPNGFRTSASKK